MLEIFIIFNEFLQFLLDMLNDNSVEIGQKQGGFNVIYSKRQSHFSVDCAQAHKGLFTGILALAVTIISLIMFFEMASHKHYRDTAIIQVSMFKGKVNFLIWLCSCSIIQ